MEHAKTLKTVIYALCAILLFQILIMAYILFPGSMFIWGSLIVITIAYIYLASISISLIKLLDKNKPTK